MKPSRTAAKISQKIKAANSVPEGAVKRGGSGKLLSSQYASSRAAACLPDAPAKNGAQIFTAVSNLSLIGIQGAPLPQLGDVVSIEWEDAWTESAQYYTFDSIAEAESCICQSVGFLIRNDEVGVTIAREGAPDGRFRGIQHIPRSMVRAARILN